jgi:cyclopropane fatty-acyl-phospholipid synthase-like methyltransferase
MQAGYSEVYGDMIQAFRPSDNEVLMSYICNSAGIEQNQRLIDAGCGTCGPAIWIASRYQVHIDAITISQVQVDLAQKEIDKQCLQESVRCICGDYHELEQKYTENSYDKVLFLESLGHAGNPALVISSAYKVLKSGGNIYIKDFYYKQIKDEYWSKRVAQTISNINRIYSYNTLNLSNIIQALGETGFEIEFIKKFSFLDDTSIRTEFEKKFDIDIFGGESEFYPAEWLEIKCTKP